MLVQPGSVAQHLHTCPFGRPSYLRSAPHRTVLSTGSQHSQQGCCRASCSCVSGEAEQQAGRRQTLSSLLAAAALLCTELSAEAKPTSEVAAQDDTSIVPAGGKFKELKNDILAYRFQYPVQTSSGQKLDLIFSRPPERYSSAAPLTADARQRTVAELLDLRNSVSVSVSVGPPSGKLKGRQPDDWKAKEVAETILADRSTARVTTGQRVALNQIETSSRQDREGQMYWLFEHSSQGSPNSQQTVESKESYRHALAVTGMRPGLKGTPYLYTLNLSCPEERWDELLPYYQQAIDSFRLVQPNQGYVPPDKDPWRFW
ncbi:hypothetical protein WJX74_001041 [Apatococcus lobatus]|uniref:PsbP C-terminal domain-containing protein n=1 Tax=Apatococcus lobatus TaxID=904363 RepID=A0AAW1S3D8_9CHLO